jgi:rsbT antagonist protein RsbS
MTTFPEPSGERIPILKMGEFLLVTIQIEMHDRLAINLQNELTNKVASTGAKGVLLDISALDMIDSFLGRTLSTIACMTKIMDAETVIVGMQPAIAITLVEMGLTLPGVLTALNVEKGMELLRARLRARRSEGSVKFSAKPEHLSHQ